MVFDRVQLGDMMIETPKLGVEFADCAAVSLGHRFVGFEIDPQYVKVDSINVEEVVT